MKTIKVNKVVFDSEEISALQTIARIDCIAIECKECPFNAPKGECCKGRIKSVLDRNNISW